MDQQIVSDTLFSLKLTDQADPTHMTAEIFAVGHVFSAIISIVVYNVRSAIYLWESTF
jgi:hypothetical protein